MWMLVMFDLPVSTKEQRKKANQFRHALLDKGFERVQFSVYAKFCTGEAKRKAVLNQIQMVLPRDGKIDILFFTDKQYESVISYHNRLQAPPKNAPKQFQLI